MSEENHSNGLSLSLFSASLLREKPALLSTVTHPLIPSSTRWSPPANLRRSASTSSGEAAASEGAPTRLDGIAGRRRLPIGGPGGFVSVAGLSAAALETTRGGGASTSFSGEVITAAAAEAGREEEGGVSLPVDGASTFASVASSAGCSCVLRLETGVRSEKKSSASDIVGPLEYKDKRRGVGSETMEKREREEEKERKEKSGSRGDKRDVLQDFRRSERSSLFDELKERERRVVQLLFFKT